MQIQFYIIEFAEKMENNFYSETLNVYGVPCGTPTRIGIFSVSVNGHPLGLISERNEWELPCSFGVFDMKSGTPVTVSITVNSDFETAAIYPLSHNIPLARSKNTLSYTVSEPIKDISLILDDDFKRETLHIFSNEIDSNISVKSTDNYIYVGPGYHNLSAFGSHPERLCDHIPQSEFGRLNLRSNQTLYVAGGAVIDGIVYIGDAENVTVIGSGIIMKSEDCAAQSVPVYCPHSDGYCIVTDNSKNVDLKNVICHSHRFKNWTVQLWNSEYINIDSLRIISPVYASTDGIDLSYTSHVNIKNCFIRSCDDCISFKGIKLDSDEKPADCPPIEDVHVEYCTLWNDCNSCIVIGEESRAAYYKDLYFKNLEVIFSYDDRDYHEQLEERSVMTICSLNATYFSDICFEKIHISKCERLICMVFPESFWFGTVPGDQTTPGGIKNVVFRNITVDKLSESSISGNILLKGFRDKTIEDITFENVIICGKKLTDGSDIIKNDLVSNLKFI